MEISDKKRAAFYVLGSAFIYACSAPLTKMVIPYLAPVMMAGLVQFGAGLGLSCVWFFGRISNRGNESDFLPNRKDWLWFAGPVIAGGVLASLFVMMAMKITTASSVSLLINLEIVLTILAAWLVFKEHMTFRSILGLLAVVSGSLCLSWHNDCSVSPLSFLLMCCCCTCWAIDNNFMGQMKNSHPMQIARCRGLFAGAFNLCLSLAFGYRLPNIGIVVFALAIGLIAPGLSLPMYIKGLKHLGVARTTAYFATEPFIGALLSILILKEPITINLIFTALLMAIGVWLHLSEKHEHEYIHTPVD